MAGLIVAAAQNIEAEEPPAYAPAPTRWALDAGYGIRLWDAGNSSEEEAYLNRAHNGLIIGTDISTYPFPWRQVGVGIVYNQFLRTITGNDAGFVEETEKSDSYRIHYAAPAVYLTSGLWGVSASVQAGAGIFYYYNHHEAADFTGTLDGVALGCHGAVSLDYRFMRYFGVGLTARIQHGTVKEILYNALPPEDTGLGPVSLTRVDVAGGIRFYP